jgi:hypothetical protein
MCKKKKSEEEKQQNEETKPSGKFSYFDAIA